MKDRTAYTAVPLGVASEDNKSHTNNKANIGHGNNDIHQVVLVEDASTVEPSCCRNSKSRCGVVRLLLITLTLGLLWHIACSYNYTNDEVAVNEPYFESSFSLTGDVVVSSEGEHDSMMMRGHMKWHPHHDGKKDSPWHGNHGHHREHEHGHHDKPCDHHKHKKHDKHHHWGHGHGHGHGRDHGESQKGGHHHPWSFATIELDNYDSYEGDMDEPDTMSLQDEFDLLDEPVSNLDLDGEEQFIVEELLTPVEDIFEKEPVEEEMYELESASNTEEQEETIHTLILDENVEKMTREEEEAATATAP